MKPTSRPVAFFLRASLAIAIPLVLMPAAYSAKADTSPPVAAPEIRKGILETTAGLCCIKPLMSEVPLSPDGFIPRFL